jgi:hypothetical protein
MLSAVAGEVVDEVGEQAERLVGVGGTADISAVSLNLMNKRCISWSAYIALVSCIILAAIIRDLRTVRGLG